MTSSWVSRTMSNGLLCEDVAYDKIAVSIHTTMSGYNRYFYWLRDPAADTIWAFIYNGGQATYNFAIDNTIAVNYSYYNEWN